jgi:hypothetical protein
MNALILLSGLAWATPGFDPNTPDAVFDGEETYTIDGELRIWSRIERLADPDTRLLVQEDFGEGITWPSEAAWAPWIAQCFGTGTPSSDLALLHVGPRFPAVAGTPILFVPGAGDNASRGFVTMATRMDNRARPVFALTFAHPHGDVLKQAELVADAIARVKVLTGAAQIDVVSHSKGGLATAAYLSNHEGARWPDADYAAVGTKYRNDVRKAIFIATPLGGIDTTYRWPGGNYAALDADTAVSPSSWQTYYPYTTANIFVTTDLRAQDFLSDDGDLFPGHRQLLRRWRDTYPLPGETPDLGLYALQQDWLTTYEGGTGFYSYSEGIDAAIDESGDLIGHIATNGVDPDVELFLLAGTNPIMPNGSDDYVAAAYGSALADLISGAESVYAEFIASMVESTWATFLVSDSELQGLLAGDLLFGELSGPSDGLVFVDSALMAETLTGRGARVTLAETRDLSHLDLLYASPITGGLLQDAAAEDPTNNGWMEGVGARYIAEDSLGWVEAALADPGGSDGGDGGTGDGGTGDGATDGGSTDGGSTDGGSADGGVDGSNGAEGGDGSTDQANDGGNDLAEDEDGKDPGSCSSAPGPAGLIGLSAGLLALVRRRRR